VDADGAETQEGGLVNPPEKGVHPVTSNVHTRPEVEEVRRQAIGMEAMLAAAFLAGMGITLIGLPDEVEGAARTSSQVLIGLHVLIALGLAVASLRILGPARGLAGARPLTVAGAVTIWLTIVAGIVTMATDNSWLSYLMAVGFIAAVLVYGRLLLSLNRTP